MACRWLRKPFDSSVGPVVGTMDRALLEKHNIYYDESEDAAKNLPPHAQSLSATLLDFECTVPVMLHSGDDEDLQAKRTENFLSVPIPLSRAMRERAELELDKTELIAQDVMSNHIGLDREHEFENLFTRTFFDPLKMAARVSDHQTRQ